MVGQERKVVWEEGQGKVPVLLETEDYSLARDMARYLGKTACPPWLGGVGSYAL